MGKAVFKGTMEISTVRNFPKNFWLSLILSVFLTGACSKAFAIDLEPSGQTAIRQTALAEERHLYSLDFLWFDSLAEGELKLEATDRPNVLRAELVGRTLGIAAWLTGDRTQRYVALMEKQPDGSLRSLAFESQVIKRRFGEWKTTRKRIIFNIETGRIILAQAEDGSFKKKKELLAAEGAQAVDILTGFYNLRAGVYGELAPGAQLEIPTIGSKGFSKVGIEVLTSEQTPAFDLFPKVGTLLKVTLDPEVFDTTGGCMYIWFNPSGMPARGILEDVIGLGDVRGHLHTDLQP